MELNIKGKNFLVGGATSGFGLAVAKKILKEGGRLVAVARGADRLLALQSEAPDRTQILAGDLTSSKTIDELKLLADSKPFDGVLINAGGPPAATFLETKLSDWDNAYESVLRWKVELTKTVLPGMIRRQYGRLLFIESISVKQPIESLVLSNSLRLAVVGMVKTMSQEVAGNGITANILAPGYHATPAMDRLFDKKAEQLGISKEEALASFEAETMMGRMGQTKDFASLAVWLLSPVSRYITGQTISVDGGVVKGVMG